MYTIDDAQADMAILYCRPCGEFKTECDCGNTYCIFCEFDCDCS